MVHGIGGADQVVVLVNDNSTNVIKVVSAKASNSLLTWRQKNARRKPDHFLLLLGLEKQACSTRYSVCPLETGKATAATFNALDRWICSRVAPFTWLWALGSKGTLWFQRVSGAVPDHLVVTHQVKGWASRAGAGNGWFLVCHPGLYQRQIQLKRSWIMANEHSPALANIKELYQKELKFSQLKETKPFSRATIWPDVCRWEMIGFLEQVSLAKEKPRP